MNRILSRLLVRVAILLASLAWAGFVFTHTVGDPGRGERIATAVLADQDARAEVTAPITSAVMSSTGVPPEQRPIVAGHVDRFLSDPSGARSFVDPFAGSWARLLGEDDPRPTEFDVAPLLTQLTATAAVPDGIVVPERLPVSGVPLPRAQLGWMDGFRSAVSSAILPLALAAAALFAIAFVIGDRARVLRRLGVWAILAGVTWVAIPPLLVWMTGRWAPGADAVVSVALDEAVSGLLPVALALVGGGGLALAASFVVGPAREPAPAEPRSRRARATPTAATAPAAATTMTSTMTSTLPSTTAPVTSAMPRTRTSEPTAEMPAVRPGATSPLEATDRMPATRPSEPRVHDLLPVDDDGDPLWEYYSS